MKDRTGVVDAEKALEIVAATDPAWTTVCAPTIGDEGPDGYVLTEQMPSLLGKVPGRARSPVPGPARLTDAVREGVGGRLVVRLLGP